MGQRASLRKNVGTFSCAFAFAIVFSVTAFGETTGKTTTAHPRADASSGIVVTETHIQLFKYALALRPEQERYWGPVEAALRDLSQQPVAAAKVQRASLRPSAKDNPESRYKRLSTAAIPLIKTFDDNQRRNLQILSRAFGFEHWLAAH